MSIEDVLTGRRPWWIEVGDSLAVLRTMPDNCVNFCMTSPPYFSLRDYGTGRWEGGDPLCDHKQGNIRNDADIAFPTAGPERRGSFPQAERNYRDTCGKCGARRIDQQIGMEKVADCLAWARAVPLCGSCFICRLVAVFAELKRVLRDDGVLCVNLGDSYSGGGGVDPYRRTTSGKLMPQQGRGPAVKGIEEGSLLGIPFRFALAMQASGWTLRSSVIWGKRAPMCESLSGWRWEQHRVKVKGNSGPNKKGLRGLNTENGWTSATHPETRRPAEWEPCPGCKKCEANGGYVLRKGSWRPTRSHEHVFIFTKGGRYWCDGDAGRTPARTDSGWARQRANGKNTWEYNDSEERIACTGQTIESSTFGNPLGANQRDVLWLGPEPCSCACICDPSPDCPLHAGQPGPIYVERVPPSWKRCRCKQTLHFAAFPTSLCRPFLEAYCPTRCCAECGTGWVRVVEREVNGQRKVCPKDEEAFDSRFRGREGLSSSGLHGQYLDVQTTTLGWRPACNCNSQIEPVPGVSLDVFAGTSTLLLTARRMGLRALGCELSPEYATLSRCRLNADAPLFSQTTENTP